MAKQGVTKIDIKQVLAQKAPKASRKIPGFIVDYLIRTVHQEELNDILTRYHDKEGVDFMRELIGYFDLTLDLVHEENIPTEGRYIFASNHPLEDWTVSVSPPLSVPGSKAASSIRSMIYYFISPI
jgi:hypothetical protein